MHLNTTIDSEFGLDLQRQIGQVPTYPNHPHVFQTSKQDAFGFVDTLKESSSWVRKGGGHHKGKGVAQGKITS